MRQEGNRAAARLAHELGLERNVLVLLVVVLLLAMGEELWSRYVPKYLQALGAGTLAIGLYGTLRDLLDALYHYPGGWIADRLGRRAALMLFAAIAIAGYAIYLASPSWEFVLFGTLFVMAWSSLTLPAIFAIIGDALPPERRAIGFGVQSILKRVPIIAAPPLGAWLIARWGMVDGFRIALVVTIGLAAAAIGVVRRYYVEKAPAAADGIGGGELWRQMDPYLKRLLLADCLARWAEGIPKVFVVLYVTNVLGGSIGTFGWLTSLQMLSATLVYLPVAKLSDRMNRKPFVLATFAFFALFPLALVGAAGPIGLALAFVVAGLREVGEPARKAMILDLSPPAARARSVGFYYLVRGLAVFPAALVGGWLWAQDPRWPFLAAFLAGVAGFVVYARWGPDARPSPETLP